MELRRALAVGGPMAGEMLAASADMVTLGASPGMAYHWTRPTDTNWREQWDPDWFIKGVQEPVPPPKVWEWHPTDWMSPEVALIRGAVEEAANRLR